ncbi:AlpA family phage regulatory protein [Shewanella cyperi]|uniref:AlpA family phage regulatory protein n=1 Tax=Shewanella cyperi TaxID=2814292 RepID=A0A974XQA7_9GAMM|nr:AlpA family phage regulatory protein [Shewanella cyperi]
MPQPNSIPSTTRLIRLNEVVHRAGLCRASIYNRMKAGTFPLSIDLGGGRVGGLAGKRYRCLDCGARRILKQDTSLRRAL